MDQEPNRDPWEDDESDDQWMEKMVRAAKIGNRLVFLLVLLLLAAMAVMVYLYRNP